MQQTTRGRQWALVLAGGDGTRLQALTREIAGAPIPKQYCQIVGERSLLETTLERTQRFTPSERTLVIINRDHVAIAWNQLLGLPEENILIQPCNRDTGPGLLFALLQLQRRDHTARVAVFPSDHYVGDDAAFVAHVARASDLVAQWPGKSVLLGIRPDRPETGLGYIAPAQPLRARGDCAAFHVQTFHEKPSTDMAAALLAQGGLWNSFVMVFQVTHLLDLIRTVLPSEFEEMQQLTGNSPALMKAYPTLPAWNFSSHFLARIPEHLIVLCVDGVHWSDWGTRESVLRTLSRLKQAAPSWARGRQMAAA